MVDEAQRARREWAYDVVETGGLLSPTECLILERTAQHARRGGALEIGHYTGLSTRVLLCGLPASIRLDTIDHHVWRNVPEEFFWSNVREFVGEREFLTHTALFQDALPEIPGPFSFVFYDAEHNPDACEKFMELLTPKLSDDVTLVYDDADWDTMAPLGKLALDAGFADVMRRPLTRYQIPYTTGDDQRDLDIGKQHPETFTLRVMRRAIA